MPQTQSVLGPQIELAQQELDSKRVEADAATRRHAELIVQRSNAANVGQFRILGQQAEEAEFDAAKAHREAHDLEERITALEASEDEAQRQVNTAINLKNSLEHYVTRLQASVAAVEDCWTDTTSVAGDLHEASESLKALGYDGADQYLPTELPHQAVQVPVALWMALAPRELRDAAADALRLDDLKGRLQFIAATSAVPNRTQKIMALQARINRTMGLLSQLASGATPPDDPQPELAADFVRGESGLPTQPGTTASRIDAPAVASGPVGGH